jgi:hypothetical protein
MFIATGIVLIVLAVNLPSQPWDYTCWLATLLIPYVLFVARLRPDSFIGEAYFPLANVNRELGGPSSFVMPVGLAAVWLALRPRPLQRKWRILVTLAFLALLSLTGYFLVYMGNRPFQVTVSAFVDRAGIVRTGPLLILAGGVLLLGAEYVVEGGRQTRRAVAHARSFVATATEQKRTHSVGFWSAAVACASTILPFAISLLGSGSPMSGPYDAAVSRLMDALRVAIAILPPVSFAALMASICQYAPPERKVWSRVGLVFAIAYLLLSATSTYAYSPTSRISRQLYERIAESLPILHRFATFGVLRFAFVSLALLLALPTFHRGGIELAIRWCSAIIGVLTLLNGAGYLLTNDLIPTLSLITYAVAQYVAFPVAMALIAVLFGRRRSASR